MVYYPMSNGRSIDEFVRLLKALQTSDEHGVATPEGWQPGGEVIVPAPQTSEAAAQRAEEGYNTVDWYYSTKTLYILVFSGLRRKGFCPQGSFLFFFLASIIELWRGQGYIGQGILEKRL
mgnify:CR=1 FL=1